MTGRQLFGAALWAEAKKLRSAPVAWVTAALLDGGVAAICAAALFAAGHGDAAVTAKLGPVLAQGGWTGYLSGANQITAVAGLLGFGVMLAWLFGREFTDGTVTGLFALPVGRGSIAGAKLVVYAGWAGAVATGLVVVLVALGLATGLGPPGATAWALLGRLFAVALLTAALALPAAWAATLGRGLLAGIGTIIGLVVVSQVAVFTGAGGWFTFSAPGLWAAAGAAPAAAAVSPLQLGLVVPVAATFAGLTVHAWRGLELDR